MNSCNTCLYQNNGFCTVHHVGTKGCDDYAQNISYDEMVELQEYRKLGTVKECREAVEKEKGKKVVIKPWEACKCPTCDKELSESVGDGYYKHHYYLKRCPKCGQKLKWSDENE